MERFGVHRARSQQHDTRGCPRKIRPRRRRFPADRLLERADAALRGPLADRPLLTIFGQYNDPLRLQPQWRQRFPSARQEIVPKGNHFPRCDTPASVATWNREHQRSALPNRAQP